MSHEEACEFVVCAEGFNGCSHIRAEFSVYPCALPDFVCDFPDREQEVFLFEDAEDYVLKGFRFQGDVPFSVCPNRL